jgi:hypothetical protein
VRVRYEAANPSHVLGIREMTEEPHGPRAAHKKQATG